MTLLIFTYCLDTLRENSLLEETLEFQRICAIISSETQTYLSARIKNKEQFHGLILVSSKYHK